MMLLPPFAQNAKLSLSLADGHVADEKKVVMGHNFALAPRFGAVASALRITSPLSLPSPKKMTSTVRSSLHGESVTLKTFLTVASYGKMEERGTN